MLKWHLPTCLIEGTSSTGPIPGSDNVHITIEEVLKERKRTENDSIPSDDPNRMVQVHVRRDGILKDDISESRLEAYRINSETSDISRESREAEVVNEAPLEKFKRILTDVRAQSRTSLNERRRLRRIVRVLPKIDVSGQEQNNEQAEQLEELSATDLSAIVYNNA